MIKVHAIGESGINKNLHDGAYIRLYLPLNILADNNKIKLTTGLSYEGYEDSDIFIFQRTWSCYKNIEDVKELINIIKHNNKKLIYEIDDNLLDIHESRISNNMKNLIRFIARYSDAIIVSTQELKKRMQNINKKIIVIPNYLNSKLIYERKNVFNNNEVIKIGYMGTTTHQKDFEMIKLSLLRILKKYKNKVKFEVIGAIEDNTTLQSINNTEVINMNNINNYFSFWEWMNKNCFWDIGIAPLKYNEFTNCKSDIKYLDYSALGIAGIYSRHPAYENSIKDKETGLLVDNNCDSWQNALEELINNYELRNSIRVSAQNDLWENRILQSNINQWLNVLEE